MTAYTRNISIVAMILMLTGNSAYARPWFAEPSVSLSAGYDDNPTLETDSAVNLNDDSVLLDDFGDQSFAIVGGNIRFGSETGADLIVFDLGATARRYNDSELDSESADISALYQKNGINNDIVLTAGFSRDSTLETELEDTGRLEENADRDEVFIGSTLTSRFSDRWGGEFVLGYSDVSFDSNTTDRFTDFEELTASAQLGRIVSQRLTVFGLVNYTSFMPTGFIDVGEIEQDDFTSVQLGINYNVTEPLVLLLSAGRGFIDTEQVGENGINDFSGNSTVYNIGLDYTGKRNTIGTNFSNSFDSSADGGLSETQNFGLSLSRPETMGGTFVIRAAYISREPIQGETQSREYYELAPRISWEINQEFTVSTEVRYREQEIDDTVAGLTDRADSTSITIGLRYDFGRKRISY